MIYEVNNTELFHENFHSFFTEKKILLEEYSKKTKNSKTNQDLIQEALEKLKENYDDILQAKKTHEKQQLEIQLIHEKVMKNLLEIQNKIIENYREAASKVAQVEGINNEINEYWLTSASNNKEISELITKEDEEVLKHLLKVEVNSKIEENFLIKTLKFEFDDKVSYFFNETLLLKTYKFNLTSKALLEIKSTKINWKPEKKLY